MPSINNLKNIGLISLVPTGAVAGALITLKRDKELRDKKIKQLLKKEMSGQPLSDVEKAELEFLRKQKEYTEKHPASTTTRKVVYGGLMGGLTATTATKIADALKKAKLKGIQQVEKEFNKMSLMNFKKHPKFNEILEAYKQDAANAQKLSKNILIPLLIGGSVGGLGTLLYNLAANQYDPINRAIANKKMSELMYNLTNNKDRKELIKKEIELHNKRLQELLNNPDKIKEEKNKNKIKNALKIGLTVGALAAAGAHQSLKGQAEGYNQMLNKLLSSTQ